MSFLPACFEIIGYVCFAPMFFGIDLIEAAVMGAVLSAVSPAVVVPRMVKLIEDKRGTDKSIPQMILAGASCDDIFVIVLFSTFLTMAQGGDIGTYYNSRQQHTDDPRQLQGIEYCSSRQTNKKNYRK